MVKKVYTYNLVYIITNLDYKEKIVKTTVFKIISFKIASFKMVTFQKHIAAGPLKIHLNMYIWSGRKFSSLQRSLGPFLFKVNR